MVAAFKHNDQTSKSNIELFIYIIVYITDVEAVIFPRFWLPQVVCIAW